MYHRRHSSRSQCCQCPACHEVQKRSLPPTSLFVIRFLRSVFLLRLSRCLRRLLLFRLGIQVMISPSESISGWTVSWSSRRTNADSELTLQNRHPSDMPYLSQQTTRRPLQGLIEPDDRPPAYFDWRSPSDMDRFMDTGGAPSPLEPQSPTPTVPTPRTPSLSLFRSRGSTLNQKDDTLRNVAFFVKNSLEQGRELGMTERHALSMGYSGIVKPKELGRSRVVWCCRPSIWGIATKKPSPEACFLSSTPLYSVLHSPSHDFTMRCYFEVALLRLDDSVESGFVVGYAAQPYPTWMMPGYGRGSLGIHSRNGRRHVNDAGSGRPFVDPFKVGDTVGIGMRFQRSATDARVRLPAYDGANHHQQWCVERSATNSSGAIDPHEMEVRVFFTRNGRLEATWDLHELVDAEHAHAQPGGLVGLEGQHDLFAAVGVWGKVDVEIRYGRNNWMYVPPAT